MFVFRFPSRGARRSAYFIAYLGLSVLLAACSNPFGGNSQPSPTATLSPNLSLAKLSWCGKPAMLFRDEGAVPTATATATTTATATATPTTPAGSPTATVTAASTATATATTGPGTPTTLTDWTVVKSNLGFVVFLPTNLPRGTCLVSAQATVHDPTFGGSFLIGYLLPDHTSITISEAPLTSQNATFQCNVSNSSSTQKNNPAATGSPQVTASPTATPVPLQLCSGAHETTNIVLSARRSVEYLQQLFNGFQSNVNWIPAS
ncbi:MAG TPA: hypothetical protein VJO32_17980 [Ktedonobacteraceae bacterium]|nr:hypothetical protein [Ktedonobacteraceae bacterium]